MALRCTILAVLYSKVSKRNSTAENVSLNYNIYYFAKRVHQKTKKGYMQITQFSSLKVIKCWMFLQIKKVKFFVFNEILKKKMEKPCFQNLNYIDFTFIQSNKYYSPRVFYRYQ